jgi:ADP-ribose pyrophosphatase
VQVLLRRGLRPALALGRAGDVVPIPDEDPGPWTIELVAGIVEAADRGEAGVRTRAALEAAEEAGFAVDPAAVQFLGAGTFPTPGSMPEKYWLVHAQVDPTAQDAATGDGSPLEHHADTWWCDLDRAIEDCVAGRIVDAKTEVALRRLRDAVAR